MTLVRHRIDGLEKDTQHSEGKLAVRHRIDGLEKIPTTLSGDHLVRHRIDGLEKQRHQNLRTSKFAIA